MKLEKLKEEILPFLKESSLTKYELAAAKEQSVGTIFNKIKVLEAAGYIKQTKQGRKTLWQINPEKPTTT